MNTSIVRDEWSTGEHRRAIRPAVVGLFTAGISILLGYLLYLPGSPPAIAAMVLFSVTSGAAAVLCFRTARRLGSAGVPWYFFAAGCFSWCLGQVVWNVYEVGYDRLPPYPSIADIGYLGLYPCFVIGLILILRREVEELPSAELVLDTAIVVTVAASLLFHASIPPVFDTSISAPLVLAVAISWQVGTLGLIFLTALAIIWRWNGLGFNALSVMMAGLISYAVANVVYGDLALNGTYYSGHLVDLGWLLGFVFFALAAVLSDQKHTAPGARTLVRSDAFRRSVSVRDGLILLSVVVLCGLASIAAFSPASNMVVAVTTAVGGVLLTARLGYSFVQSEHLTHRTRERDRLAGVVAASSAIAGTMEIEELLSRLASAAAGAVGRSRVEVYVYDASGTQVEATGYHGFSWAELDVIAAIARLPVGSSSIEREVTATQEPAVQWTVDSSMPEDIRLACASIGREMVLVAPLVAHGDVVGTLHLWTSFDHTRFTWADISAAAAIGQQAGLAIYNARLLARARQHGVEQTSLLRVSQVAIAELDLPTLAHEIATASLGIARAEACAIELWRHETQDSEMIAHAYAPGWNGPLHVGMRYALENWPSTRRVLAERKPINARITDPIFTAHEQEVFRAAGTGAVLVVPLVLGHESLGILSLFSRVDEPFDDDDLPLAIELAAQVSLAIDRARLHEALRQRADTDGLTGVLNHRAILEVCDREISRARRSAQSFAIMMIDLDEFKQINDTFGHLAGDAVLTGVATQLKRSLREYDRVGRYGGDEFMLVLPGADRRIASAVRERIESAVEDHSRILGGDTRIRLSVGIAIFPDEGTSRQELLHSADHEMYARKAERRPQVDLHGGLAAETVVTTG